MSLIQTFNNLHWEPPIQIPTVSLENEMQYNCIKSHDISQRVMYKKDFSGWRSDDSLDVDSRAGDSNKLDCEISFRESLTGKGLAPKKASRNSPGNSVNYIRIRTSFTQRQLMLLEEEYVKEEYLSKTRRKMISQYLQLPENTIKVWFQNRRMKSKRQRLESISKSFSSSLKSMKTPVSQSFFNPVPIDIQQNFYPALCHPVSYSISPTYYYQTCVPYFTSDINNGHYQNLTTEDQLHYDAYITPAPAAIPDTPPIQALEAHVINYYKNCSQAHVGQTHNLSNMNTGETSYQPYPQIKDYLVHYDGLAPCQNFNISQATESVSLETIPRQNMKSNSPPSKFNNGRSGHGKFFRPFEN